jgi:hypothetical protein
VTFEPMVAGAVLGHDPQPRGTLSLSHAVVAGGGDPLNTNGGLAGAIRCRVRSPRAASCTSTTSRSSVR